ncbi:flavodoxin [Hamiltosporidium tvaerminnensis]|uniref:Flavodoxin n=1 Tax=Hamiltosporidium tvaerminnensis TaxID=1176355 RepID=A0A4Q9KYF7_9MICR|nr:NADPH-dependent diflavin oxidoreductase 1 [Hamiltosporidium tvaerminnensis]TBU00023.1 flavodoxin [Hamiltosporidium tvaerminnensis]
MKYPIFYATQSGTSYFISKTIASTLNNGFDHCSVAKSMNERTFEPFSINNFDITKIIYLKLFIIVVPTYGDGDHSFELFKFWKIISMEEIPKIFKNKYFAVFGIGDSSYEKFNYSSKKIYNRIISLGGIPLIRRGNGDIGADNGYNSELKNWMFELMNNICNIFTCFSFSYGLDETKIDCLLNLNRVFKDFQCKNLNEINFDLFLETNTKYKSKVIHKEYLTPSDYDKEVLEIIFEINEYTGYKPGCCLEIKPTNYNYLDFIKYNNFNGNEMIEYKNTKISVFKLLREIKDINFVPQQLFFYSFYTEIEEIYGDNKLFESKYNKNLECKKIIERIKIISQDYDLYHDYVLKPKRTFFEILIDLELKVSLNFVKVYVPEILNRYFTFEHKKENKYSIAVSLIEYKSIIRTKRYGLCSKYLKDLSINSEIFIGITESNLHLNGNKFLVICTGTGIVVAKSILNYFKNLEMIIFYGFRFLEKDFLFRKELFEKNKLNEKWIKNKNLKMCVALSREMDRKYVHKIFEEEWNGNIEEYSVILAGNTSLNKEMRKTFLKMFNKNIDFQSETW